MEEESLGLELDFNFDYDIQEDLTERVTFEKHLK